VLIGISETGNLQSSLSLQRIETSTQTRNQVNQLLQQVLDAETGSRGFLLTGDPALPRAVQRRRGRDRPEPGRTCGRGYPPESAGIGRRWPSSPATCSASWRKWTCRAHAQAGQRGTWRFVLLSDMGKEHMDAIREQAGR
jgi:hypothetical protein